MHLVQELNNGTVQTDLRQCMAFIEQCFYPIFSQFCFLYMHISRARFLKVDSACHRRTTETQEG